MRSLVVTTPAADTSLLTIDELRYAAGVTDSSRDTELNMLGMMISAAITSECNIAVGIGAEPTLRSETLTETIYWPFSQSLMLSRRHNVSVSSITIDGVLLASSEYVVEPERGEISRVLIGWPYAWYGRNVQIIYTAGFATVPGDLKRAAMDYCSGLIAESGRDPFVKSISQDIPGVMTESKDYWVGSLPGQTAGPVPEFVRGQLKRFYNFVV